MSKRKNTLLKIAENNLKVIVKKGYPLECWILAPDDKEERKRLLEKYGIKEPVK